MPRKRKRSWLWSISINTVAIILHHSFLTMSPLDGAFYLLADVLQIFRAHGASETLMSVFQNLCSISGYRFN
jgi:hypothetical protein